MSPLRIQDSTIAVVGGGVLGITTGVLLQMLGAKVRLFTTRRADRDIAQPTDPRFASLFPAASVIPHSVALENAEEIFAASAEMFAALHRHLPETVRRQWHYEIFEGPPPPRAAYLDLLSEVELLGTGHARPSPLRRSPTVSTSGWRFRMFFVETPRYLEMLFRLFEHLGGEVVLRTLRHHELGLLPVDALVVCAGMGGPELLGSRQDKCFEAGYLVHLPLGLGDLPGDPASYNYTPEASLHPGSGGVAMDVYAYPRRHSLVLGGTRLAGVEEATGQLVLDPYRGETIAIEGQDGTKLRIPRPLVDLNQELLAQLLGLDISGQPRRAVVGWRYRGATPSAPLCHQTSVLEGKYLVACHGLGGAGVTLSWGLAASLALGLPGLSAGDTPNPRAVATPELGREIARLARELRP